METAEINHLPQSFVLFMFQILLEQLHLSHWKPYGHDAGPSSKQILHFPSEAAPHICLLTRNSWKWGRLFFFSLSLNRKCVLVVCAHMREIHYWKREEWLCCRKDAYEDLLYLTHLCFPLSPSYQNAASHSQDFPSGVESFPSGFLRLAANQQS